MERAADNVYRRLRNDIVRGRLTGGLRLGEADLAKRYGVSRTPIREALRRLQAEGLVEVIPHRGARVVDWSELDVDAIYDLRAVIEAFVARRAATRITGERIEELWAVCDEIEQIDRGLDRGLDRVDGDDADDADAIQRISGLNAELHGSVAEIAGDSTLTAVRSTVVVLPLVLRMLAGFGAEDQRRSNAHHRELLRAFEARDPDWAAAVMQAHVFAAKRILLRDLARLEQSRGDDAEEVAGVAAHGGQA